MRETQTTPLDNATSRQPADVGEIPVRAFTIRGRSFSDVTIISAIVHPQVEKDASYTIDPDLPATALVTLVKERGLSLLRGWLRCPFLAGCGGSFFVGRRVQLLNTGKLHMGRSVTLEDDVKIDALSREGVWLGATSLSADSP